MKTRMLLALAMLPLALVTTRALADEKATCLDAASKGQRLKATHKLVEAREELRVCAAAECPKVVQTDCASWLAEVEKGLPSVVLAAKDKTGADLADVRVSIDGQPLAPRLDGQAIPVNAGTHVFHFASIDGTSADRQVIVREGEKNQAVAAVLGEAQSEPPASSVTSAESSAAPSGAWRTAGWVLGGAGVVGLGVGAAFGFSAMGDKSSANCDANNQCQPGPLSSARSAALAADIGFIAGGVLLAGGAALVLFGPTGDHAAEKSAASVKLAPMLGTSSGGVIVGGSW